MFFYYSNLSGVDFLLLEQNDAVGSLLELLIWIWSCWLPGQQLLQWHPNLFEKSLNHMCCSLPETNSYSSPWKWGPPTKRRFLLETSIFNGYVSFREGKTNTRSHLFLRYVHLMRLYRKLLLTLLLTWQYLIHVTVQMTNGPHKLTKNIWFATICHDMSRLKLSRLHFNIQHF